jgi:hypothetical protein
MTVREILQANNLHLRVIQRELRSIRMLLIGIITICIGFAVLDWLA